MGTSEIVDGMKQYLDSEGQADYIGINEGLQTVMKIGSTILGILVVIIMIGLPIIVSIEVCYINFPIFSHKIDDIRGRLKGKSNKAFGLIVRDAQKAVELASTTENGKSVNFIYLRIKLKALIISVFIVAMVLGPGQFLIVKATELIEGIAKAFS